MHMKKIFLPVALLLSLACRAQAQIEITSELDYRAYLQYEPIEFRTSLKSRSGQAVLVNSEAGPKFYFIVRDESGHEIAPGKGSESDEPILIGPQGIVSFTNRMDRLFRISEPGQYSVQPCVDWNGKTYSGEKRHIEIVRGREVASLSSMIPADNSSRVYTIFHINRSQQDHLLLRIDDEHQGATYGVYSLGRSVMNVKPELAADSDGNAHVLMQSAPRTYLHAIYSPAGALVSSEYFGRDYATVSLESTPIGKIVAVGKKAESEDPKPLESVIENR